MPNRLRIDPRLIRAALNVSHETDASSVVTQAIPLRSALSLPAAILNET